MYLKRLVTSCFTLIVCITVTFAGSFQPPTSGNQSSVDSIRLEELRELSYYYAYRKPDTLFVLMEEFAVLEKRNDFPSMKGFAHAFTGAAHQIKGSYSEAMHFYEKALVDTKEYDNKSLSSTIYNNMALILIKQQNISKGIDYLQSAYDTSLEINDMTRAAFFTFNIASNLGKLDRYEEAFRYLEKHDELMEKVPDSGEKGNLFGLSERLKASFFLELKDYKKANKYIIKSIELLEQNEMSGSICVAYLVLGQIREAEKKWKKAEEAYRESMDLSGEYKFKSTYAKAAIHLSQLMLGRGKYNTAIDFAKIALLQSKELKDLESKVNVLEILVGAYEKKSDYRAAYEIHEKLVVAKDSLSILLHEQEKNNTVYEYNLEKLKTKNQILLAQNKTNASMIVTKKYIIVSILSLVVLAVLMSVFFLHRLKENRTKSHLLKQKVGEKRLELEELNNQLVNINKELERFAFITSHDLKEPLRNISSFSGLIKRRASNQFSPKVQQYFAFIMSSVRQMQELIDDVLAFSKASSQHIKIEQVDLQYLVDEACSIVAKTIEEKEAEILYEGLPVINTNVAQTRILLKNLIENGVKYNESEQPTVRISYRLSDGFHYISIEDNGIGIALEDQDKIFDMFHRLQHLKKTKGSGLGLAICKEVIEKLGGSIEIESVIGKGTTFTVSLPVVLEVVKERYSYQSEEVFV